MEVIFGIIIFVILASIVFSIVAGIIDFFRNEFVPFFMDVGGLVVVVVLGAIALATTLAALYAIFLFFKFKVTPRLKRYKIIQELKSIDKMVEELVTNPILASDPTHQKELTKQRSKEIEELISRKEKVAERHITELRQVYKDLINEVKTSD